MHMFMSHTNAHCDEALNCINQNITQDMNRALLEPFIGEEVSKALESIGYLKAPRLMVCPLSFTRNFVLWLGNG